MDTASDMQVLVRVVERGSFSAAAMDLRVTPSAVSKLISRLEDRLDVRLLHRTTRRLSLTPEGETFYLRSRDILAAIEDAETEVSSAGQRPRGRLRINCGTAFALHQLAPALPDFIALYPDVEVELVVDDRVVDLLAENADVGLRTGAVTDPSLIARRIAHVERGIFAAPSYLRRRGTPRTPDDLAGHDCIVLSFASAINRWPFHDGHEVRIVEIASRIIIHEAEAALRLAIGGAGIVRLGDLIAGAAMREGQLVPLLTEHHVVEPVPLSAVYPQGRHRMPKVRVFIDFLVERFGHAPWRQGAGA